jgi:hypothetical protein
VVDAAAKFLHPPPSRAWEGGWSPHRFLSSRLTDAALSFGQCLNWMGLPSWLGLCEKGEKFGFHGTGCKSLDGRRSRGFAVWLVYAASDCQHGVGPVDSYCLSILMLQRAPCTKDGRRYVGGNGGNKTSLAWRGEDLESSRRLWWLLRETRHTSAPETAF